MTGLRPLERPPPDDDAAAVGRAALLAHLAVVAIVVAVILLREAYVGAPAVPDVTETATPATSVATSD